MMSTDYRARLSLAALAGFALLSLATSPASAFTLSGPSLSDSAASAPIEKVWWDRWGNWRPNRHRVGDPSNGADGDRRCWARFNGEVHCRQN
jgi:hypothetical protein